MTVLVREIHLRASNDVFSAELRKRADLAQNHEITVILAVHLVDGVLPKSDLIPHAFAQRGNRVSRCFRIAKLEDGTRSSGVSGKRGDQKSVKQTRE